jgi:hypothetical protein
MLGPRIRISKALYEQLREAAEAAGYSSAQEFAAHVLEQAVAGSGNSVSEEEVKKRLQGLGYIE